MSAYDNTYAKLVDKTGKVLAVGEKGTAEVEVTGISSGTKYSAGDLKFLMDLDNTTAVSVLASNSIDLPALTILGLPGAPTITATGGDGKVTGVFTDPTDDGSGASNGNITSRIVSYQPATGATSWTDTPVSAAGNFEIDGLTNGTNYTFKATVKNAVGTSSDSGSVEASPVAA